MTYLFWAAALVLAILCVLAHAGLFDDELEEQQRLEKNGPNWQPRASPQDLGRSPTPTPGSKPDPDSAQPSWEIRTSPGRGLGVFATCPITQGEIILSERPLFSTAVPPPPSARVVVAPDGTAGGSTSGLRAPTPLSSIRDAVMAGFYALSAAQRNAYLACYEHCFPGEAEELPQNGGQENPGSGPEVCGRVLRIFRSNAYAFRVGVGVGSRGGEWRWGMYPLMARFNHSCCPNVGSSDLANDAKEDGHKTVQAHRDIAAGEELFVSYVRLLQDTGARRAALGQFGFVCGCGACRYSDVSIRAWSDGDGRRVEAGRLLAELEEAAGDPSLVETGPAGLKGYAHQARVLISLLEAEGLADYLPRAYEISACFSQPARGPNRRTA